MKKLLLLSASALLSLSAMAQVTEPTLTQDWKSKSVSFSAEANVRWGSGFGGKVYVNDKATTGGTLYCFSKDATTGEVKQETILATGTGSTAMALACDGAGNILMSNGWAAVSSMKSFIAVKAGTTTPVALSLTDETLGAVAARMDYLGRGVGDIFSAEGGAFFMLGANKKQVLKLYIANGEIDVTKSKIIETNVDALTTVGVNNGVVVPMTNDVASDLVALRFSNTPTYYSTGTEFKSWARESNKLAGLDYFELNDVPYIVVPAGADALDGFAVVDRKSNEVVATHTSELKSGVANTGLSNALSVEKVSDTKVRIYQYFPNQFAAQYTFEVPEVSTAIESVAVDANAPVEYYNLQGVKVANPENGLFIKKQGNKATKVIL